MSGILFSDEAPELAWSRFTASGYAGPACGLVYSSDTPPSNGMPVGGVGTGCIDVEGDGTLGFCTVFNSHVPRRGPLNLPFLGVAVGRRIFVLTTKDLSGLEAVEPYVGIKGLPKVAAARRIRYWGHYPVLDLEFTIDEPLAIGVRAFSPFMPGDAALSNTPGAVFDVLMQNNGSEPLGGRLGFQLPRAHRGRGRVPGRLRPPGRGRRAARRHGHRRRDQLDPRRGRRCPGDDGNLPRCRHGILGVPRQRTARLLALAHPPPDPGSRTDRCGRLRRGRLLARARRLAHGPVHPVVVRTDVDVGRLAHRRG